MDKYTRIKKIGEGSFGKALLVKNKENGKQMVVKEINMSRMASKERTEARKEVAVLAQLIHPNIVTYKESFEEIGNLYIVMDFCDGGDLYGKINSQRGILFQEDVVLDWFVQICLSIKHIHDRKILHRDIKSQNIFLTRHGMVKLGDFGIAKVLNSTVELAKTCIGTPYYLSPEICENRPYNNKSDVWSLGCVLYELTTLKHAFESGNMKNLVLKIIRGSYPPVPSKYSYDLRSLIAQLFKRSPRDRPSINAILRKPLLQNRIRKFLTEGEMADEFCHTVLHGAKIQKAIPANKPRPLPAKKPPAPSKTPRYNPASVYGQPVSARKSKENRKSAEVRRPPSGGPNNSELARKRQELMEKERQRRKRDLEKLRDQQSSVASRHKALVDKQRAARMNKAREEGWKNLGSLGSDDSDKKGAVKKEENVKPERRPASPRLAPSPAPSNNGARPDNKYDQYHAWLDDFEHKRAGNKPVPAGKPPAAGPVKAPFNPALAAKQGQAAGAKGEQAAERAKIVSEFLNRKQEAAANRNKGKADIFGNRGAAAAVSPRVGPSPRVTPRASVEENRNKNEEEYLSRLKQIRLQNFNERRMQQEKVAGKADVKYRPPGDLRNAEDARRKKIEALKQQADERAKKLKEELENKRKEMANLEKRRQDQNKPAGRQPVASRFERAVPAKAAPMVKPNVPMTEAMKAIGAVPQPAKADIGMTAALQAIGASPAEPKKSASEPQISKKAEASDEVSESKKSPLAQQKADILKRLNAKTPNGEQSKWGAPGHVGMSVDRAKWNEKKSPPGVALNRMSLEETGSHMEATGAGDVVVKYVEKSKMEEVKEVEEPVSARRQWGGPSATVMNALKGAALSETSGTTESTTSEEGVDGGAESKDQDKKDSEVKDDVFVNPSVINKTVTVIKNSTGKGTIVITPPSPQTEPPETKEKEKEVSPQSSPRSEEQSVPLTARQRRRSRTPSPKSDVRVTLSKKADKEVVPDDEKTPLFDKVNLEETEAQVQEKDLEVEDVNQEELDRLDDDKHEITDPLVVAGLTTGHFDTDVKMLRTCSEPDLTKLFRTKVTEDSFFTPEDHVNASLHVEALEEALSKQLAEEEANEQLDSNGEEDKALDVDVGEETPDDNAESEGLKEQKTVEEKEEDTAANRKSSSFDEEDDDDVTNDDDFEEDDEDLETLRESMMSILQTDDLNENDAPLVVEKKKVKKKKMKGKKKKPKVSELPEEPDVSSTPGLIMRNTSEEDLRTMRETMKSVLAESLLQGKKPKKAKTGCVGEVIAEAGPSGDADTGPRVVGSIELSIIPGKESWQSDSDKEDDFFEDDDDMFSRLEENRVQLEKQLGEATFLKAYKTVQAIHEDEDENMEEGMSLVSSILGDQHEHLYPSILQLVMADGAFMEDND